MRIGVDGIKAANASVAVTRRRERVQGREQTWWDGSLGESRVSA